MYMQQETDDARLEQLEQRVAVLENRLENQWYFGLTAKDAIARWLMRHKTISAPTLGVITDNYHTQCAYRKALQNMYRAGALRRVGVGIYTLSYHKRHLLEKDQEGLRRSQTSSNGIHV